ncbi:MAG: cation:proton antiporter [Candidatus Woesearchaeota archaeon]
MELFAISMDLANPSTILLGISLVILLGKLAEYLFRRFSIPDALLLISLGFLIGPFGLSLVTNLDPFFTSVFTSFALLFLLFDGSLEISLDTIVKGFTSGVLMTFVNYIISVGLITGVLFLFRIPFDLALLAGFMLGGISSSFVIPLLKQISINPNTYSELTFESALTDVLCIVFSLSMINIMKLNTFSTRQTAINLMSSVAVAFFIGILFALLWIFLETHVFKENKEYMLTVAVLILTAVVTEFFGGNAALSALFFGLTLRNSKGLTNFFVGVTTKVKVEKKKAINGELGVNAMKPSQHLFYNEISFFVKTIFFIYIGIIIDFSDTRNMIIGGVAVFVLMFGRMFSHFLTKKQRSFDRKIIASIFGRGLAAAALVQVAIQQGIENMHMIAGIVHIVITGSILISSVRVFWVIMAEKRRLALVASEAPVRKQSRTKK